MPFADSRRFFMQLGRNLIKGRLTGYKPFFLSHLITAKCNFYCPECLWKDNRLRALSTDEIRFLYHQAGACGFIANYIWGGEPLIREDIVEILKSSRGNGLLTFINTNGWYLQDKLKAIAPYTDMLIMSLDHSQAAIHDRIRGKKGSYDRIINAIQMLKAQYPKIRFLINTLVLMENKDDIENMPLLWKQLGMAGYINFIEVDILKDIGKGRENKELDVSEQNRREIAARLLMMKKEGYPILNTNHYFNTFVNGKQGYRCHFPKVFLEIYPDGTVLDCVREARPLGNVKELPLKKILDHPRVQGMIEDGEKWCHIHNNADRIDMSNTWELKRASLVTGMRFLLRRI